MSISIRDFKQATTALREGAQLRVDKDGGNLRQISGFEKLSVAFQRGVMRRSPEQLGTSDAAVAKALVGLYKAEHHGSSRMEVSRLLSALGLDRLADAVEASVSLTSRKAKTESEVDDNFQSLAEVRAEARASKEDIFGTVHHGGARPAAALPQSVRQGDSDAKAPALPPKSPQAQAAQRRSHAVEAGRTVATQRTGATAATAPGVKTNSPESAALRAAIGKPGYSDRQFLADMAPFMAARLETDKTRAIFNAQSTEYYLHLGDGARYKDIGVPKHSAIMLGDGRPMHANRMPEFGGLSRTTIATQAPLANTMADFVSLTQEQGVTTIVDLTNPGDRTSRKIPDYGRDPSHGFASTSRDTPQLQGASIDKRELKAAGNPQGQAIAYLNFTAWPDKQAIPMDQFKSLISAIASEHQGKPGGITIHCTAGVGRTGTVMAGLELQRMAQSGELRQDNYMEKVLDVVVAGREARGFAFVQKSEQLSLLFDFAQSLAH